MYVFVYGTLMSNFLNSYALFLKEQATYIGKGHTQGWLYNLGSFPGAVFDSSTLSKIQGEVYLIEKNKAAIMNSLDTYEGINDPEFDYYQKKEALISVNSTKIKALVYHLKIPTDSFKLIKNGDYLEYLSKRHPN